MTRTRRGTLLPGLKTTIAPRCGRRRDLLTHIRRLIADGVLAPGARLPSTRTLAAEFGLSRSTVEIVFDDLVAAGLVTRRQGSGSHVATRLEELPAPRPSHVPAASAGLSARGAMLGAIVACREPDIVRPFNAGLPDPSGFPHDVWQRIVARTWRRDRQALLASFDPLGYRPLREAIRRYLTTFRGVRCTADQIAITTSSQSALHLLALLLVDDGDRVWLENPGYPGARAAVQAAGAAIVPVPVDAAGLRVDVGVERAPDARLAYVTPSHQYPAGVTLALDRRVALLAWAAARGAWIIEDDYDGEFRYAGLPSAALQGLDRAGRVLYVGTLSKVLSPALRLAYVVLPPQLVGPFENLRTQVDGFTATPLQAALAELFETGQFEAHVRRMRSRYAEKRDALRHALAFLEPDGPFELMPAAAGFHATILERQPPPRRGRASPRRPSSLARRMAAAAPGHGLSLDALSRYAIAPIARDGLVLRYGALSLDEIAGGARRLRALLRAMA